MIKTSCSMLSFQVILSTAQIVTLNEFLALLLFPPTHTHTLFFKWLPWLELVTYLLPSHCYFCPCQSLQDGCSERSALKSCPGESLAKAELFCSFTTQSALQGLKLPCSVMDNTPSHTKITYGHMPKNSIYSFLCMCTKDVHTLLQADTYSYTRLVVHILK